MRRLAVRFTLSHLVVAMVGGLVTFAVVWQLAPALFDAQMRMGAGMGGMGAGMGAGAAYGQALRASFAAAVTNALLVGSLVGAVLAAVLGVWLARRLLRPLDRVSEAVGELARGNYAHEVPAPREAELAALARDVNALAAALAETEQRRLRLLGEVAHEMRTPLTVLDGYVEGMIDGVLPAGPEQLGQLSAEVRRLRRLSDDLSALSRAEEGSIEVKLESVNLDELAAGVAERLRPQAEDAGVTLTATGSAGRANVDADRMIQVLSNLIGNAIRATPLGGSIRVESLREGGRAVVRVTDTGAGLAGDDLERIFERFYRVPGGGPHSSGSGIGLTIARAYMRAQGGDLVAASLGVGSGATFTASLP